MSFAISAVQEQACDRFEREEGRLHFRAGWERTVFIHYEVDADALQREIPFELDLRNGRAYVSLVAFTLRDLRLPIGPPMTTHGFLNVRTYVRRGERRAIYFLAEWLPHPLCVLLGPRLYGLPYRLGRLDYRHRHEEGLLRGSVEGREGALCFRASINPRARFEPCVPGSLDEFVVERYTALTRRGATDRFFNVWHPPWRLVPIEVAVEEDSLVASTGPWFRAARVIRAHYSPGFKEVRMGRPRRLGGDP